jgi:hypothetical protein
LLQQPTILLINEASALLNNTLRIFGLIFAHGPTVRGSSSSRVAFPVEHAVVSMKMNLVLW